MTIKRMGFIESIKGIKKMTICMIILYITFIVSLIHGFIVTYPMFMSIIT